MDPALPYSALLFPPWAPSSYDGSPGDFSRAAISPLVNLGYQRNLDETPCLMVSKGSKKPGIELLWSCASPCIVRSEWNGFLWPCWHLPGFLEYTWAPILACGGSSQRRLRTLGVFFSNTSLFFSPFSSEKLRARASQHRVQNVSFKQACL